MLGHADNYIEANALVTPSHIVPEWYFLPFYAILRSIPNKLGGVVCMGAALGILFVLPQLDKKLYFIQQVIVFSPVQRILFWFYVACVFILGWIGAQPVEIPYLQIGLGATVYFFIYFIFFLRFSTWFEAQMLRSLSNM